jgi:hypothetical protein
MSDLYVSNNGKGWAVFKPNPTHPHKRDFAWHAEGHEWSLVVGTYYRTQEMAESVMRLLNDGTFGMKCFKCEKRVPCCGLNDGSWECPSGAVHFDGGSNYGSTLYDAGVDGIYVELVICDDCLKKGKESNLMREYELEHQSRPKRIYKERDVPQQT